MSLVWQAGLLLGFGLVLAGSAQMVVGAAATIASRLGLRSFTIAFLLLGVLTSTPEMFVALQSVIEEVPQLSMGNLLGGSILLLSLVMGVSSVLLGKITLNHDLTFGEIVLSSAVVAAPVAVLWDGRLSRLEGWFLVGVYVVHALLLNKEERIVRHLEKHAKQAKNLTTHLLQLTIGFVGMALSSRVMVQQAEAISARFLIPPFVFGLILLSLGTNLPEFALAFEAVVARRKIIAFGDFLGSAAANTLILGFLGIVSPFAVDGQGRLWFSLVLLGSVTAFFIWALSSRRDINRKEGLGLLLFYALFVVFELLGR